MALDNHLDFDMALTWNWNNYIKNRVCIPENL